MTATANSFVPATPEASADALRAAGPFASDGSAGRGAGSTPVLRPHGGRLVGSFVSGAEAGEVLARAAGLPTIVLDARTAADVELLATGVFSPLDGFLRRDDYFSVVRSMRLVDGTLFPVPFTLPVGDLEDSRIRPGREVALAVATAPGGTSASSPSAAVERVGVIRVEEVYPLERRLEAREVYRTTDPRHPGVAYLLAHDGLAVAGRVVLAKRTIPRVHAGHGAEPYAFERYAYDPRGLRAKLASLGWRRTTAFQTRNPIHRAHEHLLRCALETSDGVVVHPLVGETKPGDVPADVRMRCYEALLERYFPASRTLLAVFPFAMRYAGPREAVLHAIARQNYGFTHFIVGRDHAGVGSFYGPYDAQALFEQLRPGDLAIQPLFFEDSFYCRACGGTASVKTCPHEDAERIVLSGTKVRERLARGEALPPEVTRPEVAAILAAAYRGSSNEEVVT